MVRIDATRLEQPLPPLAPAPSLLDELGHGGMGIVMRGHDPTLDRPVAVKFLRSQSDGGRTAADAHALCRFVAEARLTGALSHPHIVPVYDVGVTADGRPYYVMPVVQGVHLGVVFERCRAGADEWPRERVLELLADACQAVACAHDQGILHRDLKPQNLMVDERGEVRVVDWGLAARIADAAQAAEKVGTPRFLALELVAVPPARHSPRTDVFALGVTLAELLDGALPPAPPDLAAIVRRATAPDPEQRYPDAHALARDLRAHLDRRVVAAYRTGPWAELSAWMRRNRAISAALLGALAIALLGALAVFVVQSWAGARAARERDVATAAGADILRLADGLELEQMLAEIGPLWPPAAGKAAAVVDLLDRLDGLAPRRADAQALRDRLAASALPRTPDEAAADQAANQARLAAARRDLEVLRAELDRAPTADQIAGTDVRARLQRRIDEAEAAVASATTGLDERRTWQFADDLHAWQHRLVEELLAQFAALAARRPELADLATLSARLDQPVDRSRWDEVGAAIAASDHYAGLRLAPQAGLVPLRADPTSGLWEFLVAGSGEAPTIDPATDRPRVAAANGIVLVLLPGGRATVGAVPPGPDQDPDGPHVDARASPREGPVLTAELRPFFLARHEITQAQWRRSWLANPSEHWYGATAEIEPVHDVTWHEAQEFCRRFDLVLPTEVQWEYAARAGTTSVYWWGGDDAGFARCENIASAELSPWFAADSYEPWRDGFAGPGRVGSYPGNGFGLHDMLGNVCEWTRGGPAAYDAAVPRAGDGLLEPDPDERRSVRGGSWRSLGPEARSAVRQRAEPDSRLDQLGFRPAREVRP